MAQGELAVRVAIAYSSKINLGLSVQSLGWLARV